MGLPISTPAIRAPDTRRWQASSSAYQTQSIVNVAPHGALFSSLHPFLNNPTAYKTPHILVEHHHFPPSERVEVQRHLADGSMKHNEAGAPVHFIEYGMVLVSPLIFRLYAAANDVPARPTEENGDFAMQVQRELLRAQWHAIAPGGKNVWTLYVSKKGGQAASRLAAVVLTEPQRWVVPVPPSNPFIRTSE